MDFATRSDVLAELEPRRRRSSSPTAACRSPPGRGSRPRPPKIARHVLRRRRGSGPAEGQDRGHPRLRLPGPRPRPQPQGLRGRRRRRPARRIEVRRARQGRRPRGHRHRRRGVKRRHRDGAAPRREAPRRLRGVDQGRDRPRQPPDVRPRLLDPLQRGRAPAGGRRRARRPQGPGPPRPPPVPRGLAASRA